MSTPPGDPPVPPPVPAPATAPPLPTASEGSEAEPRRLIGVDAPPTCDDISAERTKAEWRVWRHKLPRATLPFDKP